MSEEKAAMPDEQAADLAALEAAAALENEVPPAQAKAEAAAVESQGAQAMTDAGMLLKIARPVLERIFPAARGADASAWDALQEPIGELFAHYGVSMGDMLQNPWAKLALASVPLAYHVWDNQQKAAPKQVTDSGPDFVAAAPSGEPLGDTVSGSKNVVIGAAIPA